MTAPSATGPARRLVVALDGPASSGKSSVGAAAALELGYRFLDTGLFYRALTYLALELGHEVSEPGPLLADLGRIAIAADERGRYRHVLLDGRDVTEAVRSPAVDRRVSEFSAIAEVRAALVPRQRDLVRDGGIVMAGRDIGTVILPDADLKLYLDASPEERARRRAEERGIEVAGDEAAAILEDLRRRDDIDSHRTVAPLRPADDALVIRTDGNTFEQTVGIVVAAIRQAEATAAPDGVASRLGFGLALPGWLRRDLPSDLAERDHINPIIAVFAFCARVVARAFTRLRHEGLERIPRTGPVILAPNHISNADPVVVGAFITRSLGRRIHWLGKKEIFAFAPIGWILRQGGVHRLDRGGADVEAYRLAMRVLEAGNVLLVFPEGTRSPNGVLQEAKDGLAALALRSGAPIVPIGVSGSDRVWPRGGLPRPGGRVTVRVGDPFRAADVVPEGTDRRVAKTLVTEALMRRIAALVEPRHRGRYGAPARETPAERPTPSST